MVPISYRRHRFPPVVIQHAIWLYLRFTLSYRDVEELLAERGLDISYESVRSWVLKFGPARRPSPEGHRDAGEHGAVRLHAPSGDEPALRHGRRAAGRDDAGGEGFRRGDDLPRRCRVRARRRLEDARRIVTPQPRESCPLPKDYAAPRDSNLLFDLSELRVLRRLRLAVFLDDCFETGLSPFRGGRVTLEFGVKRPHPSAAHLHVEGEIQRASCPLVMPHGGRRSCLHRRRRSE